MPSILNSNMGISAPNNAPSDDDSKRPETPTSTVVLRSLALVAALVGSCLTYNKVRDTVRETNITEEAQDTLDNINFGHVPRCLDNSYPHSFGEPRGSFSRIIRGTERAGTSYSDYYSDSFKRDMILEFSPTEEHSPAITFNWDLRQRENDCHYGSDRDGNTYVTWNYGWQLNRGYRGFRVGIDDMWVNSGNILITIPANTNEPVTASRMAFEPNGSTFYTYLGETYLEAEDRDAILAQINQLEAESANLDRIEAMYHAAFENKVIIEPTAEEVELFAEVFDRSRVRMYVWDTEERDYVRREWAEMDRVYAEMSVAFARLARALEVNPEDFADQVRSAIYRNDWYLVEHEPDENVSGEAPIDVINMWGSTSNPEFSTVLIHEIIHQIFMDRLASGVDIWSGLFSEGATELLTRIAVNGHNPLDTYRQRTLLTAALGADFYGQYILNPRSFSRLIHASHAPRNRECAPDELMNNLVGTAIEAFAEEWGIDYGKNSNELHSIFFTTCTFNRYTEENLNAAIIKLKNILEEAGVNWNEFLISIAPPEDPEMINFWMNHDYNPPQSSRNARTIRSNRRY